MNLEKFVVSGALHAKLDKKQTLYKKAKIKNKDEYVLVELETTDDTYIKKNFDKQVNKSQDSLIANIIKLPIYNEKYAPSELPDYDIQIPLDDIKQYLKYVKEDMSKNNSNCANTIGLLSLVDSEVNNVIGTINKYKKLQDTIKYNKYLKIIRSIDYVLDRGIEDIKSNMKLTDDYFIINRAKVKNILSEDGSPLKLDNNIIVSLFDDSFVYTKDGIVEEPNFNSNVDDYRGIHVFTKKENTNKFKEEKYN